MIFFTSGNVWLRLSDGTMQITPAYPELHENAVVVWHPPNAASGVAALEGNARHATALITRRLKTEGGIDGTIKLFIDKICSIGRGYQALYTAVGLEDWQRLLAWSEAQPKHCLIHSTTRLLWNATSPRVATVLHSANQLSFIGHVQGQIVHINTLAFGDSEDDVMLAVRSLGERVLEELTRLGSSSSLSTIQVLWFSVNSPWMSVLPGADIGTGDKLEVTDINARDLRLQNAFTEISGLGMLSRHDHTGQADTADFPTSGTLLALARLGRVRDALNSTSAKAFFLAERMLPVCAIVSVILALGLAGISTARIVKARRVSESVQDIHAQERAALERLAGLQTPAAVKPELDRQLVLLDNLQKFKDGLDFAGLLLALKAIDTRDIHILGIRKEEAPVGKIGAKKVGVDEVSSSQPPAITVDGMLTGNGGDPESYVLAKFVRALRGHGYQAEAIETRGAASLGTSSRLFSYRLTWIGQSSAKHP